MKYWQIAAGDGSRDYTDVFTKFGVILVGPGSDGEYFSNSTIYKEYSFISVIAENINKDDIVVLKRPSGKEWEIIAVGKVTSGYVYADVFGDVDGWDLQHCRKVIWKRPKTETVISGLRRGTLLGINNQYAIDTANSIWESASSITISSEPIPQKTDEISVDELIDSLIVKGLPVHDAEIITSTIWRLRRIAKWYSSHGSEVGEHEIRTFLIVPLLTSLGWAEQKIKIEWNNIDVALFDTSYSSESKPLVIIESKRLWDGLRYAHDQAIGYAKSHPTCDRFVVSDGIRYKLYKRLENAWHYTAYMNLLSPKRIHPYEKDIAGAEAFFLSLVPKGII